MIEFRQVDKQFGAQEVLCGVSLRILSAERVGVVGPNGSGKSTLFSMIAGEMTPDRGDVEVQRGLRVGLVRTLLGEPDALLLDEPTTHLDIQGRATLEQALARFAGTVLLVSHDVTFMRAVATNIIALAPPGIIRYAGNYDYYREKMASSPAPKAPIVAAADVAQPAETDSRKDRRRMRADQRREVQQKTRYLRREIEALEKKIHAGEAERDALLAQLSGGGVTDFAAANQQLAMLQRQIETNTAYWEMKSQELQEMEQELAAET